MTGITRNAMFYQLQTNVQNVFSIDQPQSYICSVRNLTFDLLGLRILIRKPSARKSGESDLILVVQEPVYCDLLSRWQGADFQVADEAESLEFYERRLGYVFWGRFAESQDVSERVIPRLIKVNQGATQGRIIARGGFDLHNFPKEWEIKRKSST